MVLKDCKGLQLSVDHDMNDLEYRTGIMKHWKEIMTEVLRKYAELIEVLNMRIGQRVEALRILEEYIDTLDPSHGQIVRLRLLEGMKWAEIASVTGYCIQQTRRIFYEEMEMLPDDVQERFSALWDPEKRFILTDEPDQEVNNMPESFQKAL